MRPKWEKAQNASTCDDDSKLERVLKPRALRIRKTLLHPRLLPATAHVGYLWRLQNPLTVDRGRAALRAHNGYPS
jgi:hypothetical protein